MTDIYGTEPDEDLFGLNTAGPDRSSVSPFDRPSGLGTTSLIEKYRQGQAVEAEAYNERVQGAYDRVSAYNEAVRIAAEQRKPGKPLGFLPDWIEHPLEKLASGLYWTYSKVVSQPLAFSFLYAREVDDMILDDKDPLSARDTWNQARHFSPGQSFVMMFMTDEELADKGIDMNDVNAGLHDQKLFDSGWAKYLSGSIDFAVAWYADPTVLALRGAAAARQKTFVKKTIDIKDYDTNSTIDAMAGLVDKIRATSGRGFARELSANLISVRRSANGDDLAYALSRAKPGEETKDILRAAAGDRSILPKLMQRDVDAAAAVVAHERQLSLLGSLGRSDPRVASYYDEVLADHEKLVRAAEGQSRALDLATRAQNSLDALNFNRLTSPLGYKYRSWVDHLPRFRGDGADSLATGGRLARTVRHSFYTAPVRIFQLPFRAGRAWHDVAPMRYIDLDQSDSWRRVDAVLRNVRSMTRQDRDALVASYIRSTPAQRAMTLERIEARTIRSIGQRHGVSDDVVRELYSSYSRYRSQTVARAQAGNRNYSNAQIDDPMNPGVTIRADEFSGPDGHIELIHPILATELQRTHVLMDFGAAERIVRHSGSSIGRALNGARKVAGGAAEVGNVITRYWKVANLLSFRYAIRAVSDDLLGQVARYGAAGMAMRAVSGSASLYNRFARGTYARSSRDADEVMVHLGQMEIAQLSDELAIARTRAERFPTEGNREAVTRLENEIADSEESLALINRRQAVRAADRPLIYSVGGRGMVFPAASDGTSGAMFMREVANARSHDVMLGTTAGRIRRSIPTGNFANIRLAEDPAAHFDAWNRVVTRQIANDALASRLLSGESVESLARWLRRSPAGRDHWNSLRASYGLRHMTPEDLVMRVAAEVEDVIPMGLPGREGIIEGALKGEDVTDLLKAVPDGMRPQAIRSEIFDNPIGLNALTYHIDNAIDSFYKYANQLPSQVLSRSPLFASLYATHVDELVQHAVAQGVTKMGKAEREALANTARHRAMRDVKRMSFNMDHETRLAHALRFVVPFMGSFMESANRWFRIMSDKPQTLAHAANLFNSPTRAGWTIDMEGNPIGPGGFVTNPDTGEERLVPLSERNMVIQIPDWAQPLLEETFGTALPELPVPMTSIIPTVQGENIWNPGFGPFVQIPLAKLANAANASPSTEEAFRELGLLPFQNRSAIAGAGWIGEAYKAATGEDYPFGGSEFNNDVNAVIRKMQYDYDTGRRSSPPSVDEARSYARKMSGLKMLQKFFLPIGGTPTRGVTTRQDAEGNYIDFAQRDAEGNLVPIDVAASDIDYKPIKFFVDRYAEIIQVDPKNGMDKFLDKYGDSFFAFTVSLTKANSTVPSTTGSLKAMEKYRELLANVDPELGGLIVGPEGKGPFSQTAYHYQLETGTMTGDPMREKMSPEELLREMNRKRGWYEYNKAMLSLQADMFDAGFQSPEDRGAEVFAETKANIVALLTSPRNLDGSENPHYNREWEEDYNTQDRGFYDRRAHDMQKVVDYFDIMGAIEEEDGNGNSIVYRADIYGLRQYLANRRQVERVLFARNEKGGSDDINAKDNADVKDAFILATIDLMEKYIPFAELHNRYLARDMGIDIFTRGGGGSVG